MSFENFLPETFYVKANCRYHISQSLLIRFPLPNYYSVHTQWISNIPVGVLFYDYLEFFHHGSPGNISCWTLGNSKPLYKVIREAGNHAFPPYWPEIT